MKDESTKCYVFALLFTLGCFMSVAMVLIGAWRERIDMKHITDVADRYDRIVNVNNNVAKDDENNKVNVATKRSNNHVQYNYESFSDWIQTDNGRVMHKNIARYVNDFTNMKKSYKDNLMRYIMIQKFMHNDDRPFICMKVDGNFMKYHDMFSEVQVSGDGRIRFIAIANRRLYSSDCKLQF